MNAIDARIQGGLAAVLFAILASFRWELTCGFCKIRFKKLQLFGLSSAICPYCGTQNLLPVPRFPRDPGPRPPNWPPYQPPQD